MSKADDLMVTIATIKYHAPEGWKPRTMTVRHAVIHKRKAAAEAMAKVNEFAEDVKKQVSDKNEGIELTYIIKKESVTVDQVSVIVEDLK